MSELKKVVFDIETQKTFDEVGGVNNREQLGVSYVGVYSYTTGKMHGFLEQDLPLLEKILLKEKPTLIGFNSIHFDVPVLQPYFKRLKLAELPQIDLLKDIQDVLGHRLKLESVAQATILAGKSGSGLDAIRWYREGNFESLAKYCLDDVAVTRDVYEFGIRHGKIYYSSGGEKVAIPVQWGTAPFIEDQINEAFKRHEQLDLEYMEIDAQGVKQILPRTVEVLDMQGGRFTAFCHQLNTKTTFAVSNVWNIVPTGKTFAHQVKLL